MNTMMKTEIFNETQVDQIAQQLVDLMPHYKIFTFTGPWGAGKTTLIREILKKCGISQGVTSPTFTYLNAYENNKGQLFYHFDLYRINALDDFLMAGFEEYLYAPHSWTFVEWPAVIMPLLKEKVCFCELEYYDKQRKLTIKVSP